MAHNLCLEPDRPDGQTVHFRTESRHEFSLIPVSGVVVDEVKTGANEVNSGTPRSDMVADGDDF